MRQEKIVTLLETLQIETIYEKIIYFFLVRKKYSCYTYTGDNEDKLGLKILTISQRYFCIHLKTEMSQKLEILA